MASVDLSRPCPCCPQQIGPVFITRSFGCALGALASTYLYGRMRKNTVIYVSMQALMAVLVYLPFTASKWSLHAALLAAGLFTAIVDTGCQIMTQRLYGATAGSYLGANLLAYSVSGACVPVLAYITDSLVKQYAILAAMTGVIGVIIFLPPAPETVPGMMEVRERASIVTDQWMGCNGRVFTPLSHKQTP